MRVSFARSKACLALHFAFSTLGFLALAFTLGGFYAAPVYAQAQSNAADLRGFVRDPAGSVVSGATVTVSNASTGTTRTATTNDEGFYQIIGVPPGDYEIAIEATNFKRAVVPTVQLTVGQRADLDVALEVGGVGETVTVSGATTELVETSRTAVSNTIDETRIDNLPINERNYLNFALTISTVGRDNGRPVGPAPTSGLNFGGQRGRSNLVQVDGADNTDNSVNAARSTVSQEAVQEFQIVTNSFAAEFGRATGGVVNVVTKGGTNDIRGNVFGFIRNKRIQSRNAFSPIIDGDPNKKPGFTRAQYGATLGGALARDRTFFFAAHEQRRRQESGFFTSDVAQGLTESVAVGPGTSFPFLPFPQTFGNLTASQATFIRNSFASGNPALIQAAIGYAYLASGGASVALTGSNPLISPGGTATPITAGTPIGARFFLSGAPVPVSNIAFRPLNSLQRVFPISEGTQFSSLRIDHRINDNNQLVLRGGYNPSEITGIQVESQNQSLGQNDFSRTGIQRLRDSQFVATLTSTLSDRIVNEARFQFGGRRAVFVSQNNDAVSSNISGTAFFGRELFSPVNRSETRYQYVDNVNIVAGNHTFKFGADINYVNVNYIFELNFAGLFNFGGLSAGTLGLPANAPDFTPVQQYGIGFPGNFIQGFGNPASDYTNKPFAFFAQDSWKATQRLTVNYGVRYDVEFTRQIAPVGFTDTLTGITLSADQVRAAQDVVGVTQGIPRDTNNIAPRLGVAYDLTGDGRTVIRAAGGLFYDHPLLAIAANSDIADAAQQNQGILLPGNPANFTVNTATGVRTPVSLNAGQVFQGTVCVPGATCPAGFLPTPAVAASAEYQFGRQRFNDQTFFGLGPVLPFTLPIASDFEYAYATQANASIERQLTRDISVSATYLFVGSRHLPKPIDVNAPRTDLQIENFRRFAGRDPLTTTEAIAFALPTVRAANDPFFGMFGATIAPGQLFTAAGRPFAAIIPGIIAAPFNPANGTADQARRVITPAIANFFRPTAPNYFLAFAASRGAVTQAVLDSQLAGTLRTPGLLSPFGSVNAQSSSGSSNYNAGTLEVKKRFSNNFQFLGSYTFSKSIDDSSDLQTLLLPQDNFNFRAERSLSLFDQRHRFVFSGVLSSPDSFRSSNSFAKRVLADFIVAPIFEISSGRPFNILSNQDTNNDQSNQTDRPSVAADGTLFVPGAFQTGNLGRNSGITEMFQQLDLRVARNIRFGERVRLEVIAEGFNLFNRFNQAAASPFITDVNAFGERTDDGRYRSRPTAAFDARQFQFGLRLNF
ncbi:MAG: TonB-dependent receptor [Pyrinomonadaceae bacterium MAG19_C2-C3]|nr:TonB-dependent receptor [Pyrinomonadaceae bacterium MAG19_C2-C3]